MGAASRGESGVRPRRASAIRAGSGASTGAWCSPSASPRWSLLVGGGVLAYELLKRPADVHNAEAAFQPQKPKAQERKTVNWPLYGYDRARTRYLPAKGVRPPFRKLWRYTDGPLLEFPPTIAGGKLYFVNNSGFAIALDADTGKQLWKRRIGRLNASSPAYYKHRLYIVNLVPGHVVKLDARTGRIDLETLAAGRGPSPRRWSSAAASTSAARTATSTRSAPATATCAGRPGSAARSSRRPPTTAASSTSATTAAT